MLLKGAVKENIHRVIPGKYVHTGSGEKNVRRREKIMEISSKEALCQ